MNRRTFLKIAGMGSFAFASGCGKPDKTLYSLVQAPDDMVTGQATWYAATCRECPAGCGVLAKNREGRVIKLEGNPLHPINRGKLCLRGQAALQAVYNPDRLMTPRLRQDGRWQPVSFDDAEKLLRAKLQGVAATDANPVRMLSEVSGPSRTALFTEALQTWQSGPPVFFEPFAYETLKAANRAIFGLDGLPGYRIDQADCLICLGADFLETWLSPVEYARQFKAMHALANGRKGLFVHVGPYQSLTAANADRWLACRPGCQAAVAGYLIGRALNAGRGQPLPSALRGALATFAAGITEEQAVRQSGLTREDLTALADRMLAARKPLILGAENGAVNGLATDMAANLLNLVLDPKLTRIDFQNRHRVEQAATRAEVIAFFENLRSTPARVLLLNNVNPVFAMPANPAITQALKNPDLFVVALSNFEDETTALADLILPVKLPLESWDDYNGQTGLVSTLQPAMGKFTEAPDLGDLFLRLAFKGRWPLNQFKAYISAQLEQQGRLKSERDWIAIIKDGGHFQPPAPMQQPALNLPRRIPSALTQSKTPPTEPLLVAAPSIRFFDGRGANRSWLNEIPDPTTRVAWQSPVWMHPEDAGRYGVEEGDVIQIESPHGKVQAPVYETVGIRPGVLVLHQGQGHTAYGRYAAQNGANPLALLPTAAGSAAGAPQFSIGKVSIKAAGHSLQLAQTASSRVMHGRKIALTVDREKLARGLPKVKPGLTMHDFPKVLPLPEGYSPRERDFYPAHEHIDYRWSMAVDMDRCIGCGACSAACYAENNLSVVQEERILEGREMSWISIERYLDQDDERNITFLPLMCQHCNNAPCESVCPVYAPHHSKEGLNNQIYNRCIGTRFCAQNCPYKVRRFNWYAPQWPSPAHLQINPEVTARSKGVMEKCSFCIQRIKQAHDIAKNENRKIREGEIIPACVQTCPTDALVFGNLMDPGSRVRQLFDDPRAYQIMGYLNTKPAVIYLKKVRQKLVV